MSGEGADLSSWVRLPENGLDGLHDSERVNAD